jgi:hypothetical protein
MMLKLYYLFFYLLILSCTPLIFFALFGLLVALSDWDIFIALLSLGILTVLAAAYHMLDLPNMRRFWKLRIYLIQTLIFLTLNALYADLLNSYYFIFYLFLFFICLALTVLFEVRLKKLNH